MRNAAPIAGMHSRCSSGESSSSHVEQRSEIDFLHAEAQLAADGLAIRRLEAADVELLNRRLLVVTLEIVERAPHLER